jgi:hypothetical protein
VYQATAPWLRRLQSWLKARRRSVINDSAGTVAQIGFFSSCMAARVFLTQNDDLLVCRVKVRGIGA